MGSGNLSFSTIPSGILTPLSSLFPALYCLHACPVRYPLITISTFKLQDSQKYLTLTRHTYSAGVVLMSMQLYNSLPEDVQNIIKEVVAESVVMEYAMLDTQQAEHLQILKDAGMEVVEDPDLESFKAKLTGVIEKYGARFSDYLAAIEAGK